MALYCIAIFLTFQDYGITSDETHHVRYGQNIVQWYTSGFQDRALFETKNTFLYGGLFDTLAYLFSQTLPLDRYDANHLFNAWVGVLGVVAAHRIGSLLGGPAGGFFAALFLVLTPRYYGHAFNNPKDIPFAVAYLWSLYYIIRCYIAFPNLPRSLIIKTGIALGCALGIRIGGALLVAYVLGFTALFIWQNRLFHWQSLRKMAQQVISTFAIAYGLMLLCWPWALTQPLTGPITALFSFSHFSEPHMSFFGGQYVVSTNIPLLYAPTWLVLTLPEFVLFGLLLGLAFFIPRAQNHVPHFILCFAGIFPILYAMIMSTPLYDGIRHLLFVIPPLVVFSALACVKWIPHASSLWMRRAGLTLGITLLALTFSDLFRLHPNQYIYFNRLIAGGIQNASQNYETDYWENSFKQGIRWIEKQYTPQTKVSVSGFSENIQHMLDKVRITFEGYPERGDIYLGVTRFDRHRKIPGEILHIVKAYDTPLLYLIRPDTSYQSDPFFAQSHFMYARQGEIFSAENQPQKALEAYLKARDLILKHGTNSTFLPQIYLRIGNQYDVLENHEQALSVYHKVLDHTPRDAIVHNNIGVTLGKMGDIENAIKSVRKAITFAPTYFSAYVNLASLSQINGQLQEAENAYRQALKLDPTAIIVRKSVGLLSYQMGDFDKAISDFRHIIDQNPNDVEALYNLSLAFAQLENYAEAQQAIERAITLSPDDLDAYVTQGAIAMYLNNYPKAIWAYQHALQIQPHRADLYSALGIAFLSDQKTAQAKQAFETAITYNPNEPDALQYLQQFNNRSTP